MKKIEDVELPDATGNPRLGWVSDVAAEMFRRLGIRYFAMNPGASYRGLHDSLVNYLGNRDPQLLMCLHEDHAVSIAHGYARVTGEPMGCILHSNVGLMHGLMGIFNAWCNRAPMLVIGATGPVDAPARRPWIDWIHTAKDQGALLRNFTKWDDEPRSAQAMVESIARAMQLTRTAPTAPVYICLDAALQEDTLANPVTIPDLSRFEPPSPPSPSAEAVSRAADMLLAARHPMMLPGRASRRTDDWERRVALAEILNAKVATDIKAGAAFPTDHPLHVNVPSHRLNQAAKDAIREADVILSLDWVDLGGTLQALFGEASAATAKVISCTLDPYLHNGWSMDHYTLPPADLPILADPDVFVARLLEEIKSRGTTAKRMAATPAQAIAKRDAASAIAAGDVERALASLRNANDITLTNVMRAFDTDIFPFRHPLDYLGHDGGGGLGTTPGAGIGAALALKDSERKVVCAVGDGDFMQGATSIWTAAHYRIPVLFLIWNNRSNYNDEGHQQTMARDRDRPQQNKWIGQRIDDPAINLAGFARDMGVASDGPVETVGALDAALARAFETLGGGEPYLIDVRVVPVERAMTPESSQRKAAR